MSNDKPKSPRSRKHPHDPEPPVTRDETQPPEDSVLLAEDGAASADAAKSRLTIVGIGASAGGLDAFERFFKAMPPDSGMAFVIVQHLDPTHKSILTEIVSRFTRMNVYEVSDGMPVEPNCTYIIPPNRDMAIMHSRLHLMEQAKTAGRRLPIDFFFRSLAADQGEQAVCIVLSGTGTEGTLGLKAIKGEGGLVIVQSPESSQYDGMPRSAAATGLADFILPPEAMPAQLISYARHMQGQVVSQPSSPVLKSTPLLQKIFILLRAQSGNDFSLYKQNTILRRVERRMSVNQIDSMSDYVRYLSENPAEVATLFKEMLIQVTNFFRDPDAFAALKSIVIPAIFRDRPLDSTIRVWVPGCSTGEEAYSIAILLREHMDEVKQEYKVQIFATDIDKEAVEFARAGIYPETIVADLPGESYQRFFSKEGNSYQVKKPVRDLLVFAVQNVIKDPPFSKLDLISCRNLLIYMGPELQKRALRVFQYALKPQSYLFLGNSESIGEFTDIFTVADRKWKLYQHSGEAIRLHHPPDFYEQGSFRPTEIVPGIPATPRIEKVGLRELVERTVLREHSPAAVLINVRGEILYIHGHTGKYLEPSAGEASMNLPSMAREGLRLVLGAAIRRAAAEHEDVLSENVSVKTNGDVQYADILVTPLPGTASDRSLLLVIFRERPAPLTAEAIAGHESRDADSRVTELENELRGVKEHLQSSVEELETSNEELHSTNEELQSANEELQSTNEELETSKEELQSVNEELVTVNSELETNLEELSRTNNYLNNLLTSTDIGTIFLNSKLCVDRYTPAAIRFVNLIPGDVGRALAHLAANLEYKDLVDDAAAVLDTLATHEQEVPTVDGRWCLVRILPYRTVKNVIDGVVIAFIDITKQKRVQEQLRALTRTVEQSPSLVMITDASGAIQYVNPRFTVVTGYTSAEVIGKNPRLLHSGEHKPDFYQRMWNTILAGQEWRDDVRNRKKNGELFWETLSISPIMDADGQISQFVSVGEDTAETVRRVDELQRLARVVRESHDAITILASDGRILEWNRGAVLLYGWSEDEAAKMSIYDIVPPEDREPTLDWLRRVQKGESLDTFKARRLTKDGQRLDIWMTATPLAGEAGGSTAISTIERPVS